MIHDRLIRPHRRRGVRAMLLRWCGSSAPRSRSWLAATSWAATTASRLGRRASTAATAAPAERFAWRNAANRGCAWPCPSPRARAVWPTAATGADSAWATRHAASRTIARRTNRSAIAAPVWPAYKTCSASLAKCAKWARADATPVMFAAVCVRTPPPTRITAADATVAASARVTKARVLGDH